LQIQSKATIPTVIVGLARPGVMLTILGKKISAPWTYAALERGMEAYPGQPTVSDLNDVYHYPDIEKNTRLMGVTGFGDREFVLVGALNAAFRKLGEPTRCWPLGIGNAKLFRKMMDIVKLKSVAIDPNHRREMVEVMGGMEPAARQTHAVDLVVREEHEWHGYNVLWRAAGAALEGVLRQKYAKDKPLTDRVVLIVGTNETAKTALLAVKQRHAIPIVASYDKKGVQEIAKEFGCRHVLFDALYSTAHDILVVCSDEKEHAPPKAQVQGLIHPGYLKPSITVMDLTSKPRKSTLLREAQKRGCDIVEPREVLLREALLLLELTRGEGVPREFLEPVITDLIRDDD
jgi:3-dehydroquinate dehydratase/shikimate dehydrogenase